MAKKYISYNLVACFGEVNKDYENYKDAYSAYCKEVRNSHPATLYGRTLENEIYVIFSKG